MLDIAPSPVTPLAAVTVTGWGEPVNCTVVGFKATCAAVGVWGSAKFAVAFTIEVGMVNVAAELTALVPPVKGTVGEIVQF